MIFFANIKYEVVRFIFGDHVQKTMPSILKYIEPLKLSAIFYFGFIRNWCALNKDVLLNKKPRWKVSCHPQMEKSIMFSNEMNIRNLETNNLRYMENEIKNRPSTNWWSLHKMFSWWFNCQCKGAQSSRN